MRIGLVVALGLSLLVGACAPSQSVLTGGQSLTATIQNPAGRRELAQVELGYQVASKLYIACRNARCTSTANLRRYQSYDRRAYAALVAARRAVRDNPTISGLTAIGIAQRAVFDFQNALQGVRT